MSNFRSWYIRNQEIISGFVAGILLMNGIDNLIAGHLFYGLFELAIAVVNLYMVNQRM
jgi:hypothetical protein